MKTYTRTDAVRYFYGQFGKLFNNPKIIGTKKEDELRKEFWARTVDVFILTYNVPREEAKAWMQPVG